MRRHHVGDDSGHGHRAVAGGTLGRSELRLTGPDSDQLAVHPDLAVYEVDTVRGQAEHLTGAEAHAGGED